MNHIACLICAVVLMAGTSCQSSGRKKNTPENRENSVLGAVNPGAQMGGYYRLKGNMNGFYHNVPIFTQVLPDRFLPRRHVVQLLDPSAGDGWARVKNEDLEIGYVKFDNIRIVPPEKQPRPPQRDEDEELDQRMQSR